MAVPEPEIALMYVNMFLARYIQNFSLQDLMADEESTLQDLQDVLHR